MCYKVILLVENSWHVNKILTVALTPPSGLDFAFRLRLTKFMA